MKLGRLHWGFIGIVTVALVIMAPSDNEDNTKIARSDRNSPNNSAASDSAKHRLSEAGRGEVGRVELERLDRLEKRQQEKKVVGTVFNATSWYVPPPPRHVKPPPPAPVLVPIPTAPPLPFTYLGRYGDSASRIIILSKGDRVYTVTEGDIIENTYRVEKLTAGQVNLTYLPLNIEQSLRTGEAL
jgi:hypothetical protein